MKHVSTLFALTTLLILQPAFSVRADGRTDWPGYDWHSMPIASCTQVGETMTCPTFRQKWDWKRNQWVEVEVVLDPASAEVRLNQRLINNDRFDDDNVCVTLVLTDSDGLNVAVHHANWHSLPHTVMEKTFVVGLLGTAPGELHFGTKQCRRGPQEDNDIYRRLTGGI